MEFTAKSIAEFLEGTVEGNPETIVNNISKIEDGRPKTLSFLANPKYTPYIYTTKSSVVLVNNDFKAEKEINTTLIRVKDAYQGFASLLNLYVQSKPQKVGISKQCALPESASVGEDVYIGEFASIGENVTLGKGVKIYPQVYIGDNVTIADNTKIFAGAKIYEDCVVGAECIIHAGAVIGADGFGFAPQTGTDFQKIPQIGNVILEDRVEIGANTCVDRATMGSTIIRRGVKLDNLIQIGHNVELGDNTVIAALSGISGSTKVGKNCMVGGQTGMAGHLTLADNTKMGAQTGIMKNVVKEGQTFLGSPAQQFKDFFRSQALFYKLPDINRKLNELERSVQKNNTEKNS